MKIGAAKSANPKQTAVESDVRPVRPPAITPALLSTKVVTVEVPRSAPAVVPTASAKSASLTRGS